MTRDGVIVDTSVLIDFLKGKDPSATAVAELVISKRIYTTGIIMAELLQGARTAKEEAYATELMDAIPALEVTSALWMKTGRLACSLRRKGKTPPLSDIAISVLAMEHNLSVFSLDGHFQKIPGLTLYKA